MDTDDTPEALHFWQEQARHQRERLAEFEQHPLYLVGSDGSLWRLPDPVRLEAQRVRQDLGAALARNTVLALRTAVHAARRIS